MREATWLSQPYLSEVSEVSIDGGTTSSGHMWHAVSPRWGHSMHPMCSYHGMFPARLVHHFLHAYTKPGDFVFDPFSGRGTTVLQARVEGRTALGNDLNPLAYVLTRAKARPPSFATFLRYLSKVESAFLKSSVKVLDVPPDIKMLFHPRTLNQIVFLRSRLMEKKWSAWTLNDFFLAGVVAGILHGSSRTDGTSAYLSISMPNTFSMSPAYVKKYIKENGLKPPEHSVFDRIREKAARLYLDAPDGASSSAHRRDAVALMKSDRNRLSSGSVDMVLTSPPYLRVVNYGTSNWIRLWWLGLDDVSRQQGEGRAKLDSALDHGHNYPAYKDFMEGVFQGIRRVLKPSGVAVVVIGDVAQPDKAAVPLATQVWTDTGARSGLRLIEVIDDFIQVQNKVSRIWGETRGQATETERFLILGRSDGATRLPNTEPVRWDEPYKDAGPDAAHDLVFRR